MGFHGKQIQPGTLPLDRLYTTGYIPSAASDLTTVEYVQALNQGLFPKAEARVRAIGNVNLASPAPTQDGVTMVLNDRMVLGDQLDPTENGIYDYAPTGLVRSIDADDPGDLKVGTFIYVQEGATWAGFGFFISGAPATPPNIDIGVDPILFSTLQKQISPTAENGLTLLGNSLKLGGPLVNDTDINGGGLYNMTLSQLTNFEISTPAAKLLFDKGGSTLRIENGASTEVFMDLTDDWRFNLAMDDGGGAGEVNASYSVNLAANGVINDTNSVNAAANTVLALGAKYSFAAGRNHLVGDGTGTRGDSSAAFGIDTINYGEASITSGVGAQILHVANQRGGIAHGFSTGSGLKPVGIPYVTAVSGAVNISRNTAVQTPGFGALAQDSVILGGYDHNIPASSPGSVILGGSGIIARSADPNQVYVPGLNIATALLNDDALGEIMVRDPLTGQIKYRSAGSLVGAVDVENGLSIDEGFVILGGPLVQNTEVDLAEFEFNLTSVDPAALINFELTDTITTTEFEQMYNNLVIRSFDASNSFQLAVTPLGGLITVGGANPALQYAADYSAYYTNRSLVDKEYVDDAVTAGSFVLTNGNGTTANGTAVDLGGLLTGDVDIEGNFQFVMGGNTESLDFISLIAGDGTAFSNFAELSMSQNFNRFYYFNGGNFRAGLELNINGSELRGGFNSGNGDTALRLGDNSGPNTTYFRDSRIGVNQSGLEYFADYSANYTSRSLVDKEYVDNAITGGSVTASNGLTKVVGDIQLGGTLTEASTIVIGDTTNLIFRMVDNIAVPTVQSGFELYQGSAEMRSEALGVGTGAIVGVDSTGTLTFEVTWSPTDPSTTVVVNQTFAVNAVSQTFNNSETAAGINYSTSQTIQSAQFDAFAWSASSTDPASDNLTQNLIANWGISTGFQMYRQRYSDIAPDPLYAMFQMNIDDASMGIYEQGTTGSGAFVGVSNSAVNSDYTPYALVYDNVNNGVMTAFRLKRTGSGTGTTNPNAIGIGGRLDYELLIGPIQQVVTGAIDNVATAVGAGWETKFIFHVGNTGALTPVMEIDKYGAKHSADYSANYTNRSLVDKEYVDSAITGGDFWSLTGTSTLLSTVTIDGTTAYNVNFTDLAGFTVAGQGVMNITSVDTGLVTSGVIGVTGSSSNMLVNTTSGAMSFSISNGGGLTITDVAYARGVQYAADYSANYTARSLVDKAYVDAAVSGGVTASNGLTETAGDIKLGGALTANTSITGAFDLSFGTAGSPINTLSQRSALVATANSQELVGVVLNTSYTDGAFTSVVHTALQVNNSTTRIFQINGDGFVGVRGRMAIANGTSAGLTASATLHLLPFDAANDGSVVLVDGGTLVQPNSSAIRANTPTSASQPISNVLGGSYTVGGAFSTFVQGTDQWGFNAQFLTPGSHGLFISNQSANITNYDGYMALIQYACGNANQNMTASTNKGLLTLRKVSATLNGFDHTGAFVDMYNGFGATGDFIKAAGTSGNFFRLRYNGNLDFYPESAINVNTGFGGLTTTYGGDAMNYSGVALMKYDNTAGGYASGSAIDINRRYTNTAAQPTLYTIKIASGMDNDAAILAGAENKPMYITASSVDVPTHAGHFEATLTKTNPTNTPIAVYAKATITGTGIGYTFYGDGGTLYNLGKIVAGTSSSPAGSLSYTFGDGNVNSGVFGSAMFGELSIIDVNVGAALAVGESVWIRAYGGKAFGRGTRVNASGGFALVGGGWTPGGTDPTTNDKVTQASGFGAFGFYGTDGNQTDNHGALANQSAILGGMNHNIPADSPRSVILGGNLIKARAADPDQVYVPNLNITIAPAAGTSGDNVLVRDAVTGEIKEVTQASIGGGGSIGVPQPDNRDMVPSVTSGDEEATGLTIDNTPTGLIIIALNGEIKSLGNGVKTKHCYFSGDAGVTARAFSAIVAGDELYWNGTIAGYDLDGSDTLDFYYI